MSHQSKEYYMALAEMHAFDYDTEIEPSKEILAVYGVVYQMENEVISHSLKNGISDKAKLRMDGLKIVLDFLGKVNACYSRNHQYRIMLKNSMIERSNLEKEIERLNKEAEAVAKAFKGQ